MARISSAAVTILLCLLQTSPFTHASTSIINGNGVLTHASISDSSFGSSEGIVGIISSPGTQSPFDSSEEGVNLSSYEGVSILSSPGATLSGTSSLAKGNGAAAVGSVAGSIILSGITESDWENGLLQSRHGLTLTGIFRAKIDSGAGEGEGAEDVKQTKLFLVFPQTDDIDEDAIKMDVKSIFQTVAAEKNVDIKFDSAFEINVAQVANEEDAKKVMDLASEGAAEASSKANILSSIANAYSAANSATAIASVATAGVLACDDSFSRYNKATKAKLASWKSRTTRGLTVDNFGSLATQLLERTMESYDRDTLMAAGSSGAAAAHRLEVRMRLQGKLESAIRDLFKAQIEILEKNTVKKFNNMLLNQYGKDNEGREEFYNANAAAISSAALAFEAAVDSLEVPTLSLTKTKAVAELDTKLNTALLEFPDSPAARLKLMKEVTRTASKQKKPTERNIDIGLDLVAMLRPDGFGNLQGFAGYQLGGNNIIVGVHNDADAPDVISQFGGKRPPFVRVQPKLKVDVEL